MKQVSKFEAFFFDMKPVKVAIQGIHTSFHDVAAGKFFGEDCVRVECDTFQDCCDILAHGEVDFAVMAIENSIAGSILGNYSLIRDYDFHIIGEVYLRIQMALMALPGTEISDLKIVQSHPIAIGQSAEFLHALEGVQVMAKADTALCAKEISENQLAGVGALASEAAAKKFGLCILNPSVETNKMNFTRFLVLSKKPSHAEGINKASVCFELHHGVGKLADMLLIFKETRINLSKIQSVPIVGKPYQYSFYATLEWERYEDYLNAVHRATEEAAAFKILGEYPKGEFRIPEEKPAQDL